MNITSKSHVFDAGVHITRDTEDEINSMSLPVGVTVQINRGADFIKVIFNNPQQLVIDDPIRHALHLINSPYR